MSGTVQEPFIRHARTSRIARFSRLDIAKRLRVQRQWLWSYFTGQRGSRLIPDRRGALLPGPTVERILATAK
jgi:hypothetical protein